jgi:hypothetical protein
MKGVAAWPPARAPHGVRVRVRTALCPFKSLGFLISDSAFMVGGPTIAPAAHDQEIYAAVNLKVPPPAPLLCCPLL